MKSLARITAEADGRGGTRLVELYGEAPLLPRRTGPTEVHLVGGAAGPLGGDELCVELHVGPGATLTVRTVAASIALPGDGPSHVRVVATVADGATLHWLPEPIVAAHGCDHVASSDVSLAASARLHWREELVCGRHDEEGGDLTLRTSIARTGLTLYRQDLTVGPAAPWSRGPAVLGGARCTGSLVVVDPGLTEVAPQIGEGAALMPLAGPGYVVTAVAAQAHHLRQTLTALVHP